MSWAVRVVRNRYVDSVRLMKVAKELRAHGRAEVAIGTPANLETLAGLGVICDAGPSDIVIAVEGPESALDAAERELDAPAGPSGDTAVVEPPRSLPAAARSLSEANVALISVPGEFAALEAHRALTEGMHVFLFSDHVSERDEVELKRRGAELGLLVMGPGCGTAMLGAVGLGFANVVKAGRVGIVAAAGTGAQEAASLLDGAEVVQQLGAVDVNGKRVVAAFVGWDSPDAPFEIHPTLDAGAFAAADVEPPNVDDLEALVDARRCGGTLLGLYSGGSLAHEAVTILEPVLGPIGGNAGHGEGPHTIFDLGEEEYTQGRPHPMVDLEVRLGFLEDAAGRDGLGCVLLDVVIGHGSHPDPAGGLAPALAALATRIPVIAHVCGTDADPQHAGRQEETLRAAGVIVAPTNAAAARLARRAVA